MSRLLLIYCSSLTVSRDWMMPRVPSCRNVSTLLFQRALDEQITTVYVITTNVSGNNTTA